MDRHQLAAFDQVVREGSFTRAAVALGLGQPAVSARLKVLEDELGGTLFTRGRRVALTALGESFLPYARRALEVLDEGVEVARRAQVGQRGCVRLASLGSLAGGLLGPALAAFAREYPEVECVIRSGNHERVVSLLLDGVVDLGLVTWPCTEAGSADLQAILTFHEPVPLVASPAHPLAAVSRIREEELVRLGRPFFLLRWWQAHHPTILGLAGVALVELEVQGLPRISRDSALVRRGRGGPLSPATANLVEAIRRQAVALGLHGRGRTDAVPRPKRRATRPRGA